MQSIAEISDGIQYTPLFTHIQEQLIQTTTHRHRRAMRWSGTKMPCLKIKNKYSLVEMTAQKKTHTCSVLVSGK